MEKKERILIVDILRGFALLLIVLIHSVEHFEFFRPPEVRFLFSKAFDDSVMKTTFLLISGKAYSIFALLFGLSFFIQMDRKAKQGIDYRYTFLWRMIILLVFGFLHSLIYKGDILHIYALLAIPIIFMYKLNTKLFFAIALLLVIQLPFIYEIIQSFMNPDYEYVKKFTPTYPGEIYVSGSLLDVISYNVWKGRETAWLWTYYNGRYLQIITLFIIGMLLGRKRIFENTQKHKKSFIWALIIGVSTLIILNMIHGSIRGSELSNTQKQLFNTLIISYKNLAATTAIVTLMVLIYLKFTKAYIFRLFAAYGKMSLTNYITQAVFGVIFFYGFGFGMYKYLGTTWSILLGVLTFYIQALISDYWNKKYFYGPLEWLWRCLTDLNFNIRFKRY